MKPAKPPLNQREGGNDSVPTNADSYDGRKPTRGKPQKVLLNDLSEKARRFQGELEKAYWVKKGKGARQLYVLLTRELQHFGTYIEMRIWKYNDRMSMEQGKAVYVSTSDGIFITSTEAAEGIAKYLLANKDKIVHHEKRKKENPVTAIMERLGRAPVRRVVESPKPGRPERKRPVSVPPSPSQDRDRSDEIEPDTGSW